MKKRDRILQKLKQCRPFYERALELRGRIAKGEEDWVVWGALERQVQLALECALDVGEMVISSNNWERPEDNKDVFRILGEMGVLPPDLARKMMDAAGLRNILVHQYADLDRERFRRAVMNGLHDVETFGQAVLRSLGEPEK